MAWRPCWNAGSDADGCRSPAPHPGCARLEASLRLRLLGVRGSTPAPGEHFVRYGGHTSCIAVAPDAGAVPDLVLDAGTGLRALSPLLGGRPFRGAILLSHLHWDHVQGMPFFAAGDHELSAVDVYLP